MVGVGFVHRPVGGEYRTVNNKEERDITPTSKDFRVSLVSFTTGEKTIVKHT